MSQAQYEQQGTREAWEQQERVVAYQCPYCYTMYPISRSDCNGTDISCCSEVGHCESVMLDDG